MTKVTGFILILLTNIGLMLILTMIIAALTLIERRILALVQRRVGPTFVGYKGRLQYIADALKLFTKAAFIPDEANRIWFITIPSIVAALCYSLWMNSVWAPSLSLFEIEYNLVYVSLFSILFSFCVMLTGYFSHNKYAMIASIRCAVITLNLELFMGLLVLNITLLTRSFSFLPAIVLQESVWLIFTFLGISGLIIITFLLETNRTPFDLAEAESELVAGYTVEYGGFFFGLFYLGEYLHLFFGSAVIAVLFLGGWESPTFLWFIFTDMYIFISYIEDFYYSGLTEEEKHKRLLKISKVFPFMGPYSFPKELQSPLFMSSYSVMNEVASMYFDLTNDLSFRFLEDWDLQKKYIKIYEQHHKEIEARALQGEFIEQYCQDYRNIKDWSGVEDAHDRYKEYCEKSKGRFKGYFGDTKNTY